ncbi:MAG: NAD-dependent epimerase/dehydratase family protein [Candidatus Sungbacteria bacterium]|nr:NAD-dependent epimerase/dehydratase family protein [Candidatus Sungbacteria bacterium]
MICITGGSGFFGIALVEALLKRGEKVRVLDIEPIDGRLKNKVDFRRVDIRDSRATMDALRECDMVYHNAAVVPISRAGVDFWAINEKGTRYVLEGALRGGARRVIHYSTSQSLYGIQPKLPVTEETSQSPFGDYGKSKHAAELVCLEYRKKGLDISIVRPRTIIGAGRLGIFQMLFEWIRTGSYVYMIGRGQNRLQFIGLEDLIQVSLILKDRGSNEDFNIGAEKFGTVREDLKALIRHAGTGSRFVGIPGFLARPGLALLDMLNLSPFVDLHYKTIDHDFYFDVSKAKRMLGWSPQESNFEALVKAYDWYALHAEEIKKSTGTTHRKAVKKGIFSILR